MAGTATDPTIRLLTAVAAVCPIDGVDIGTFGNKATVTIHFNAAATTPQKTAAQNVVNTFDWSAAAQLAWQNLQARTAAVAVLTSDPSFQYKVSRAIALLTASWITQFYAAVAAATTLADLKTRVAALPDVSTPAKVLALVQAQISGGQAD
jgi:hypothetical protein